MHRWWLIAGLIGCAPVDHMAAPGSTLPDALDDDRDGTDDEQTPDASGACDAELVWLQPDDDAQYVAVDSPIVAGFSSPLGADGTWSLGIEGVEGTSQLSADRREVTFVPDAPLAWLTEHTVQATVCERVDERHFTTTGRPAPLGELVGTTWAVDLSDLQWVSPGIAGFFVPFLGLDAALLYLEADGPDIRLRARLALDEGAIIPLPCAPVLDMGIADLRANPRFSTAIDLETAIWRGTEISLGAVRTSAFVDADTMELEDISISALLDLRAVESLTGLHDLCEEAARVGDPCQACPTDSVEACMPLIATQSSALPVDMVDIFDDLAELAGLCD